MRTLLAHCIEIYRPTQVDRIVPQADGSWLPETSCGPLCARIRFLRLPVPLLWALDLAVTR